MSVIVISGTPGTGKTTYAQQLAEFLGFTYLSGKEVAKGLDDEYDHERDCSVIDIDEFNDKLKGLIDEYPHVIIDSHLAHDLDPELVDLVVITTCDKALLKERLEQRGYSEKKVKDNLEVEIFDVCYNEAKDNGHKIIKIQRDNDVTQEDLEQVKDLISS